MNNLIAVFLTGLLTGGLTCMAVQGGLLMATLAEVEEKKLEQKAKTGNALPILAFLIAKLTAYTFLGLLLGIFGSFFVLTVQLRAILLIAVAIFMVGTALNILDVHPIFRYFVIQPPRFLTRLVRKQSKNKSLFSPIILGAFTVFIPCGTTQAMMALAIASGSPLFGAAILFAFVLGTSPLFFILGYFATKLGDIFQQKFMKLAAVSIIILAIFNLSNAMALTGTDVQVRNFGKDVWCIFAVCDVSNSVSQVIDNNPTITIRSLGYSPNSIAVKSGAQVRLKLINTDGTNCAQAFTIPSLGIEKVVAPGNSQEIVFKAPDSPTQIPFMCSMGMFRGTINVL